MARKERGLRVLPSPQSAGAGPQLGQAGDPLGEMPPGPDLSRPPPDDPDDLPGDLAQAFGLKAPPPGKAYPTFLYHPTQPSRIVRHPGEWDDAIVQGYAPIEALDVSEDERKAIALRG